MQAGRSYMGNSSDWTAAMHMNLQADNAARIHAKQFKVCFGVTLQDLVID